MDPEADAGAFYQQEKTKKNLQYLRQAHAPPYLNFESDAKKIPRNVRTSLAICLAVRRIKKKFFLFIKHPKRR